MHLVKHLVGGAIFAYVGLYVAKKIGISTY
jgi:hypothetical protein